MPEYTKRWQQPRVEPIPQDAERTTPDKYLGPNQVPARVAPPPVAPAVPSPLVFFLDSPDVKVPAPSPGPIFLPGAAAATEVQLVPVLDSPAVKIPQPSPGPIFLPGRLPQVDHTAKDPTTPAAVAVLYDWLPAPALPTFPVKRLPPTIPVETIRPGEPPYFPLAPIEVPPSRIVPAQIPYRADSRFPAYPEVLTADKWMTTTPLPRWEAERRQYLYPNAVLPVLSVGQTVQFRVNVQTSRSEL